MKKTIALDEDVYSMLFKVCRMMGVNSCVWNDMVAEFLDIVANRCGLGQLKLTKDDRQSMRCKYSAPQSAPQTKAKACDVDENNFADPEMDAGMYYGRLNGKRWQCRYNEEKQRVEGIQWISKKTYPDGSIGCDYARTTAEENEQITQLMMRDVISKKAGHEM